MNKPLKYFCDIAYKGVIISVFASNKTDPKHHAFVNGSNYCSSRYGAENAIIHAYHWIDKHLGGIIC